MIRLSPISFSWALICVIVLVSLGCRPKPLEQTAVDLQWGFRLDEAGQDSSIASNLAQNTFLGTQSLLVELPFASRLDSDSVLLPHFPKTSIGILASSGQEDLQLTIAMTTANIQTIFPDFRLPEPGPWFAELEQLTDSLLNTFPQPPARFVLGNDLRPSEGFAVEWSRLLKSLRKKHPQTAFGYGKMLDEVPQINWWNNCDFIAVEYPPLADPNPRPFCIEHTPPAAQLADSLEIPVFIYRANVMGKFKVAQMKNRLRFWQPIQLSGLVLNSLYSRVALLDSTSYFALGKDEELKGYLEKYVLEK